MNKTYKSWVVYSVGIYVAWGVVFTIRWQLQGSPSLRQLGLVFAGFVLGWLSATIKFVMLSKKTAGAR